MSVPYRKVWMFFLAAAAFWSCQTTQQAGIQPASIQTRDVFTCKGLTADNRWVGVTDTFLPEEDTQVVVVAKFNKDDLQGRIFYELTSPMDMVVLNEEVRNPRQNPLGILFPMDRLLEVGEEGEWRATVYVDQFPIGDAVFHIGEKPEDEDDTEMEYFIVGEESLNDGSDVPVSVSEEERFSSYIQETTPVLEVPASAAIDSGSYTVIE